QKALFSMYLGYGMVDSMAMQMGVRLKQIWGPLNGQALIGILDRPWIRKSLASRLPIQAARSPFLMLGLKKGETGQAWLGRLVEVWPKVSKMSKRIGKTFAVASKKQGQALVVEVSRYGRPIATIAGHGRWLVASASPKTIAAFLEMWDGKAPTLEQGDATLKTVLAKRMQHFSVLDLGAVMQMFPRRAWPREFRYMPLGAKRLILTGLLSLEQPLFGLQASGNDIHLAASTKALAVDEHVKKKVDAMLKRLHPQRLGHPLAPRGAIGPRGHLAPRRIVRGNGIIVEKDNDKNGNGTPTPVLNVARKALPGLDLAGSPVLGQDDAPVTIVAFSDFQCPFCARAANTISSLTSAFPNQIRLVFKHRPLSFHRQAKLAAIASMAAHRQGKFWPYHDKLFANRRNLNRDDLIGYARDLGMDLAAFESDLNDDQLKKFVEKDDAMAVRLGARGTPTFFINGYRVVGAQPLSRFKQIIRDILKGKAPAERRPRPRFDNNKRQRIAEGIAPTWGSRQAKVTIAIFSDFQCPFCARAARTVDQIKKAYPGKVRFVFKHLPLPFHKQAKPAAIAAMAAHRQGKFWEYHDQLFANYRSLSEETFLKIAQDLQLDMDRFKQDVADPSTQKLVEVDAQYARTVGANGTPTFFVNGYRVVGAQPFYR
ncbi:MAG: thioredoxin domain-containing protein, partial [Pseudomonadales bacterium]|nr:thioredoxin domain-containing protein [Pseudomonadales bacterium]